MISATAATAASDLLRRAHLGAPRLDKLPTPLRPTSREEGYAIQACLESWGDGGIIGWKIAATSTAGQAHIGVDGPLVGRYLPEMVLADGATVSLGGNLLRVAEPEFAFILGRDLPPRPGGYALPAVLDAVATLRIGIEVPDTRFADVTAAGAPQLIADNACALLHVLGPEVADWRAIDLVAQRMTVRIGDRVAGEGVGANVLGDPRRALLWMVNEMTGHGTTLRAGQFITTGTCATPVAIAPGDVVTAGDPRLGSVGVRFLE